MVAVDNNKVVDHSSLVMLEAFSFSLWKLLQLS